MEEIEFKIKYGGAEKYKVVDYCLNNGFEYKGASVQRDIYLTPSHRNITEDDEAIRVRHESGPGKWTLTYKGKNKSLSFHDREELETAVDNGEALLSILAQMDFRVILEIEKTRELYSSDSYGICIDEVKGLGTYIEIEYLSGESGIDRDKIKREMEATVAGIGLDEYRYESRNYLYLLFKQLMKQNNKEGEHNGY